MTRAGSFGSLVRRVGLCLAPASILASIPAPGPAAPPPARAQAAPLGTEVGSTLGVQFTDKFLHGPDWRRKLDLAAELGASVVRIDLNWPWTEVEPGRYAWALYDDFAAELKKRGLRPLFILNRPNRLHGRPYDADAAKDGEAGIAPPRSPAEIAAFARWAAAAARNFRHADPIWEIWNEPDGEGFWPPRPDPGAYVRLARAACAAIRQAVPGAFVTGPAAAEMPTVWAPEKPLVTEVLREPELTRCLDAVSLHTHRFGQEPETVSRDYAILRREIAGLPGRTLPVLDTEWGDSVFRKGLSEAQQARWLPRMVLVNLLERVGLTNWYCLVDTGDDDAEMEDRFGLIAADGRLRPAYHAYRTLARQLRGTTLRQVIAQFDRDTAKGATVLLFCDPNRRCKLAAWSTDDRSAPARRTIPGWKLTGPIIGHLGQRLTSVKQDKTFVALEIGPEVQFADVQPVSAAVD